MPVIRISDSLYKKLESLAKGFDTPQNVIERLIEKAEGIDVEPEEDIQSEPKENIRRQRITSDMVKQIYPLAKDVFHQKCDTEEARDIIIKDMGMKEASAMMYLNAFQKMMEGECYKGGISGTATEYFLTMIRDDFGPQALKKALSSVEQHIEYKEGLGYGKLQSISNIHHKFSNLI